MAQLTNLEQLGKPAGVDDQLTAAQVTAIETAAVTLADFLDGMLSQVKRIIHGEDVGNWYDDPVTVFSGDASLKALAARLLHENQLLYFFDTTACLDRSGNIMRLRDVIP